MSLFPKRTPAIEHKWPDTAPPDKSSPYWEFNNNLNINGTPYRKEEVEPEKWQWIVDEASLKRQREWEQERRDLWWALRSRLLTDEEMEEVKRQGSWLNVEPMQSYNRTEKAMELTDALHKQALLRLAAQGIVTEGQDPKGLGERSE